MKNLNRILLILSLLSLPACGRRLPSSVSSIETTTPATASSTAASSDSQPVAQPVNQPVNQVQTGYPQTAMAQTYPQAMARPTPPPAVQIHPEVYANPYYPQGYGQRPVNPTYGAQQNYVGGQYPVPGVNPVYNNNRRAY